MVESLAICDSLCIAIEAGLDDLLVETDSMDLLVDLVKERR